MSNGKSVQVVLFSQYFGLKRRDHDDWFDPVLTLDTALFVDPFLLFKDTGKDWADAHAKLVTYFDRCFELLAKAQNKTETLYFGKAIQLLRFPEPSEYCLGYVKAGTAGAGSGRGYAKAMAGAINDAIKRGVKRIEHFEELGIFNEGMGPDRISDMTCNILRPMFIRYTQGVAERHKLPLKQVVMAAAEFDENPGRWRSAKVMLPANPFTGEPILLTPQRFLRDLPVLNADDWWESTEADQIRLDLNIDVMEHVDKKRIIEIARAHPESVHQWVLRRENEPATPYDLPKDPKGVHRWAQATAEFAEKNPLKMKSVGNLADFIAMITDVIELWRLYIEEQGGWRLLWNDNGKEKPEEAAQLSFYGLARTYCATNNVVLDREVNLGRGPVDFKFSSGYKLRALLEMKKLHNGKFWAGFHRQLPSYMTSDRIDFGWFVAIQYRSGKPADERVMELTKTDLGPMKGKVNVTVVDGRPKKSASKLE